MITNIIPYHRNTEEKILKILFKHGPLTKAEIIKWSPEVSKSGIPLRRASVLTALDKLIKKDILYTSIDTTTRNPKTCYSLKSKTSPYFVLERLSETITYGGNGIYRIKNREKAKTLFDVYLRYLYKQFTRQFFEAILATAFSPDGQKIRDRLAKGNYSTVHSDVSQMCKKIKLLDLSSHLAHIIVEIFSNADIAFDGLGDKAKASVNQFLINQEEQYCDYDVDEEGNTSQCINTPDKIFLTESIFEILEKEELEQSIFDTFSQRMKETLAEAEKMEKTKTCHPEKLYL